MDARRKTAAGRFRFADRHEAAALLALEVGRHTPNPGAVLGLPRGGVVVAAGVAERLAAPLGVVTVGKIRTPGQAELATGAVAVWEDLTEVVQVGDHPDFAAARDREVDLARERDLAWSAPLVAIAGATVVVVDDGLATGATMQAALRVLRRAGAGWLVAAVPVGSAPGLAGLNGLADVVTCVHTPRPFRAVGDHYDDFSEVADEAVRAELVRAARRRP